MPEKSSSQNHKGGLVVSKQQQISKKDSPEKNKERSAADWIPIDDLHEDAPEAAWSKYPFFVPTMFVVSMYEMTYNSACRKIREVKKKCGDPPRLPLWRFCEHEGLTVKDVQMFYGY